MFDEKQVESRDVMEQELYDMWGIKNRKKYIFYYDESNNCRKFWVDDVKMQFNTDYTADFVLAGVVKKEDENIIASLEMFRQPLKLQPNVNEIKFNKHFSKGEFLECVKVKRLFEILSWVNASPLYIHYLHVNNLYYTLVEIFDSVVKLDEIEEFGYDYFGLKSIFYYMFKGKEERLQSLMVRYKYPNIKREDVEKFCKELMFLLGSQKEMKVEEKFIAGMIAKAADSNELIFLHDNDDYIMQKNYVEFYMDPIRKYYNSKHVFDIEMEVQAKLKDLLVKFEGNKANNYEFVNSENEIFVQLSDVVAGILGKLFKYINSNSINDLRRAVNNLSQIQIDNILLIDKLRTNSNDENIGFLHSIAPYDEIRRVDEFFKMVRNKKDR